MGKCSRTEIELELELIQSQMAQKPMLRGEVGARALRNQTARADQMTKWCSEKLKKKAAIFLKYTIE